MLEKDDNYQFVLWFWFDYNVHETYLALLIFPEQQTSYGETSPGQNQWLPDRSQMPRLGSNEKRCKYPFMISTYQKSLLWND